MMEDRLDAMLSMATNEAIIAHRELIDAEEIHAQHGYYKEEVLTASEQVDKAERIVNIIKVISGDLPSDFFNQGE